MEPAQRPLRIPRRSLRVKIFADLRSFAPLGRRGRLPLRTNKPRVQAPRHASVGGPLDDRPAIGKQSHLVGLTPELQHEVVMPHLAVRLEALVHNSEVYGPVTFVNLHGIPPTQSNVRPSLTFEMNEVSFSASPTSRSRLASLNLRALVRPHIQQQQCPS